MYDRVNKWGGAERVLLALHELFPNAPLYTSVYNSGTAQWAKVFPKVIPSFLQNLPFAKTRHDLYAPLMPLAFESFDFSGYDVVISVTSEAAKGIITKPGTLHICYCLTPTRYLWSGHEEYFKRARGRLAQPLVAYLRAWDKVAAQRPDVMVAISKNVASRIKLYYSRKADVIYPPVDVSKTPQYHTIRGRQNAKRISKLAATAVTQKDSYFLVVSRLVPYKKIDLVVKAFNKLGLPLVIVGTGSEENTLRRQAKANIKFVGLVNDKELLRYYQGCKALIFPQNEDFGIAALEAQAAGRPVIAYKGGGALETVIEGKTGIFFEEQTVDSLMGAVRGFDSQMFKPENCIRNAQRFSKETFSQKFAKLISAYKTFSK